MIRKKPRSRRRKPARRPPLVERPYTVREGITYSLQQSFGDCRERCRLHLHGWRRSGGTKEALEYGSLIHLLLERLGKAIQAGTATSPEDAAPILDTVLAEWRASHVDSGTASADEIQQSELVIAKARAIWPAYCAAYPEDFDPTAWLDVEGTFDIPWRGYRLRGRRDGIRRDDADENTARVFETKTTSQISDDDMMSILEFDAQVLFYIVANQAEFAARGTGERIAGATLNVIRNPGERRLKSGSEPLPEYTERVGAKIAKDPAHYFKRYEAIYLPEQITAFADRLASKLRAFTLWAKGYEPHYWNDGRYGGCVKRIKCEYLPICSRQDFTDFEQTGRLFVELED